MKPKEKEKEKEKVPDRPTLLVEIHWKRKPEGFANALRFQKGRVVQTVVPVIFGIHLSTLITKKEGANLGISVGQSVLNRREANRRNETIMW